MAEMEEFVAALEAVVAKALQKVPANDGLHIIVRPKDVFPFCGLKATARDELAAQGKFPKPIPLTERAIGYLASELAAWQKDRIAERDAKIAAADDKPTAPAPPVPPKIKKVRLKPHKPRDE
jgi:prophage regulatory protein